MDAFEEGETLSEQSSIIHNLIDEFRLHLALEEQILYPALRDSIPIEHLLDQAQEDRQAIEAVLDDLQGMDSRDPLFADKFVEMEEKVSSHIRTHEGEIFLEAENADLDLLELGGAVQELRAQRTADLPEVAKTPVGKKRRSPS